MFYEIRKFTEGDNERWVILFPEKVKWYIGLWNIICDRCPIEKYVVEEIDALLSC